MKIFLLCRSIEHPYSADSNSPQLGDIVQFRRADKSKWGDELKHFTIVLVDLNIPCGDNFKKARGTIWECKTCKDNNIDDCEFQKFITPEFKEGSLLEMPKVLKKRRYQAQYTPTVEIKDLIDKGLAKTPEDEVQIMNWALSNEKDKTIIFDKKGT